MAKTITSIPRNHGFRMIFVITGMIQTLLKRLMLLIINNYEVR